MTFFETLDRFRGVGIARPGGPDATKTVMSFIQGHPSYRANVPSIRIGI